MDLLLHLNNALQKKKKINPLTLIGAILSYKVNNIMVSFMCISSSIYCLSFGLCLNMNLITIL